MRLALAILFVSSTAFADRRVDAVMKPHTGKDRPGCAVALVQGGKVDAKGYGMADLERGVAITPDTVFDIGSTSKQFTAASILVVAAEGKLALDDDIRKHVPELPALSKQPITIRQLLHHTGGLRDYTTLLMLTGKQIADVATVKDTLAILSRQRGLEHEPGAKHAYSNTGYFVLAQIVERASKQSLATFERDRFFRPLGMTRSMVLDAHATLVPGRAIGYSEGPSGWRLEMSQWEQTGDGAVQTTVRDLARWDANFYAAKVGGKALVEQLQQRGALADGTQLDYAAGLMHGTYRGQPTVSHGGAWAGYRAQLLRFPALKTSMIVLCNAQGADPSGLAHRIADAVLAKHLAKVETPAAPVPLVAVALSPAELDAWAGKYRDVASGGVFELTRDGDALLVGGSDEPIHVDPTDAQHAVIRGTPIAVELAGVSPKRTLRVRGQGLDEQYAELSPYKPAAADLAAYAGRYYSPELGVVWTLTAGGATLRASGPGFDDPVDVVARDELSVPGVTMTFVRATASLTVDAGGVRGLVFERMK